MGLSRRLPPLNSLRAFEAAARHASFARAADRAGGDPVRRASRSGCSRPTGGDAFSAAGARADADGCGEDGVAGIAQGLRPSGGCGEGVRGGSLVGPLVMSAIPSFAGSWLLPRLERSHRRLSRHRRHGAGRAAQCRLRARGHRSRAPLRQRRLSGARQPAADDRDGVPGLRAQPLERAASAAAAAGPAAPSAAARQPALQRRAALRWGPWLRDLGLGDIDPARGVGFSDARMLMERRSAGMGVALGRSALVADDIAPAAWCGHWRSAGRPTMPTMW